MARMTEAPKPRRPRRVSDKGRTWPYALPFGIVALALLILAHDVVGWGLRSTEQLDRALRLAIAECRAEDVTRLIDRGADANRVAPRSPQDGRPFPAEGSVPLQAYSRCDTPDTLQALRDGGVDLAPEMGRLGNMAISPGRPLVLAWLLENGLSASAPLPNLEGWETMAHRAARRAQADVLAVLLAAGGDANAPDSEGFTPLGRVRQMIAAQQAELADPATSLWAISHGYEPQEHFADVIALLQQAGGTE